MPDEHPDFDQRPSKSELKRQMTALQELGEALTRLSAKQLQRIPIDHPQLMQAIKESHGIRSNSARRRHMQYIGKLMRSLDPEPIRTALAELDRDRNRAADKFHRIETLRDEMLAAGAGGVELAARWWPDADRQHLRQLLRQHQRELQQDKAPAASRKLFRYLRELQEIYGEPD